MKKILSTLIIAFVFLFSNAQDYEITFAGAGASSTVDSVLIENLTQGTSIKLSGTDTLFLTKVTTGINSFNRVSNLPLTVYPNPFSSECKIEFTTQKSENITILIFDLSGRLTASKVQLTEPGNHHFQIKGIPRGMYIVQVRSASLFQTAKILSYNQNSSNPEIKYQGFSTPVKTQLINKSASGIRKMIPYYTDDNILLMASNYDDNFFVSRGITMNEDVEIEDSAPFIFEFMPCEDPDGRNYSIVKIGDQTWMSENYAYETENGSWVYDNDESKLEKYGRLYTWEAARNNAPDGWRLPTEGDWIELVDLIEQTVGIENAGISLKNNSGWLPYDNNINGNGTNATGFSGLPGGSRFFANGTFYKSGEAGYWWIDKDYSDTNALMKKLTNNNNEVIFGNSNKGYGFSVRYIRKNIPLVTTIDASEITNNSAYMNGSIDNDRGYPVTEAGIYWSKTNQNPDAKDNILTIECTGGLFGISKSNLDSDTTYYYRAFATNEVGTSIGAVKKFTTNNENNTIAYGSFLDSRDGTFYKFITIGNQTWMAENLAYLPSVSLSSAASYTEPYYYVYDYEGTSVSTAKATDNYGTYGVLYNWSAAKTACPGGWHLPTDAEWTELENALTGVDKGSQLASNASLWNIGDLKNSSQFGTSGFSGLPGGCRRDGGYFVTIGGVGYWWSATEGGASGAWSWFLGYSLASVNRGNGGKDYGVSVRCLRD